jgi:hypothetical protein
MFGVEKVKINNRYTMLVILVINTIISAMLGGIISNLDRIIDLIKGNFVPNNLSQTKSHNSINSQDTKSNIFFVLAGESFYPDSLANEPNRVKARIGLQKFNELFKVVKVCNSFSDSKKYYLVVGSNLSEEEANNLKQQATNNYFRPDTYLLERNLIDFHPSQCKKIP